jgi:PAS domain-containing protein
VVKLENVEMDMIPQTRTALAGIGHKSRQPAHLVETDAARTIAQGIVDTNREPLLVLDRGLRLVAASRAFCSTFGLDIGDIIGRPLYELGGGEWNIPQLRLLLEQIIPEQGAMKVSREPMLSGSLGRGDRMYAHPSHPMNDGPSWHPPAGVVFLSAVLAATWPI